MMILRATLCSVLYMLYLAKTCAFVIVGRGHIKNNTKLTFKYRETIRASCGKSFQCRITDGKNDL